MSHRRILILAAMTLVLGIRAAQAELQVVEERTDDGHLTVYKMTVTPAAEPVPALRYRLLPTPAELLPGNAALFYTRAFAEGGLSGAWKRVTDKFGKDRVYGDDARSAWYSISLPLDQLPLEDVRQAAAEFDSLIEQFVERATVRRDCDWGHEIHELRGPAIVATLLPEIQESRSLSRALMLRARLALAEGDYPRVLKYLRMNYRLAQNVGRGPFVVSGLVGIAEAGVGNAQVIELIASPDSPNLYWALAEMSRPLIDLAPSVRYEMSLGMRMFPGLDDAEHRQHSPEEWANILVHAISESLPEISPQSPSDLQMKFGAMALSLMSYSAAKERLIAAGMDADRVEAMPVGQVVAADAVREYRRLADEMEKWWYVPLQEARKHDAAEILASVDKFRGGFGQILASLLLPALSSAREAQTRLDWQLNGIQTVEAIRMHAAETGKLPASLDEIACVPVPKNPITEEPYAYRLEGETAILELPKSDGFTGIAYRFEIKLAE